MARTSPSKFIQEVQQETRKVTWPSWKETRMTTLMVFIMVVIVSVFLSVADWAIGNAMRLILGSGA
jgi:preprotein translocase subunit SecE